MNDTPDLGRVLIPSRLDAPEPRCPSPAVMVDDLTEDAIGVIAGLTGELPPEVRQALIDSEKVRAEIRVALIEMRGWRLREAWMARAAP